MKKQWTQQEYWEDRFQREDTPWDLGEPSPTLVALEKAAGLTPGASVFVPGCGKGNDALHFARLGYQVTAIDWSELAVQEVQARAKHAKLSLRALQASFWELPASWGKDFDAWIEHTFFCAIDLTQRQAYLEQCRKYLKPGGKLLGTLFISSELADPAHFTPLPETGQRSGPPFFSTEKEIHELFKPDFELLELRPSPHVHPGRSEIGEWRALFRRR